MQKRLGLMLCFLIAPVVQAGGSDQVDLILFAQSGAPSAPAFESSFIPLSPKAIRLKPFSNYALLKPALSSLNNEYYRLKHNTPYKVLGHFSWIQPQNNHRNVVLPTIHEQGWTIKGTVQIQKATYYTLNADLQCAAPEHVKTVFTVRQKQRLKSDITYYLDNPKIGLLIKIHKG